MKKRDFGFINQQHKSTGGEARKKTAHDGNHKRSASSPAPETSWFMENDGDRFLRIVKQASKIRYHRELLQLLQGQDIQYCIPHQILISAWGDFDGPHLQHDVVSALPGLRTGLLNCLTMDDLLKELYKRWFFHGRQPLLLDSTSDARLAHSACGCALHKFLQGAWSLLVHGVIDLRDGNVSLYLALNAGSIENGHSIERFRGLVDPLITQIDVAFRKIATLRLSSSVNPECAPAKPTLSPREEEVLMAVSEGKTNSEISYNLAISAFTVKNHLQRIMKKLHAANRTEAVAKHRQIETRPQRYQVARKSFYDLTIQLNP
jgi:transcriptional regulator EpsA